MTKALVGDLLAFVGDLLAFLGGSRFPASLAGRVAAGCGEVAARPPRWPPAVLLLEEPNLVG
jgi:hypothetical protein